MCWASSYFYPRPPRGGRRCWAWTSTPAWRFLSTPSARRATTGSKSWRNRSSNFYPRPPRGGRHHYKCYDWKSNGISIHALREEGDLYIYSTQSHYSQISIHALREEGDTDTLQLFKGTAISIHALREEGDYNWTFYNKLFLHFYPRPPRGGRPVT